MAKAPAGVTVTSPQREPSLALVLDKPQALDLPKFDLDAFFILHKGNLAVVHEAQAVLADAIHEIARVQYGYVEQVLADTRAALSGNELTEPAAALANAKAVVEQSASVTKEVLGLTLDAQKRIRELLFRRARTNLDEFTLISA